jgi:hypothetical protein
VLKKIKTVLIQTCYAASTGEPVYQVVDECWTSTGLREVILFETRNLAEAENLIRNRY